MRAPRCATNVGAGRRDIQVNGLSGQSEEGKQMTDVLDDLKKWANLKVGDQIPNEWGPPLTAILKAAVAEIEHLRRKAGEVSDGESSSQTADFLERAGAPLVVLPSSPVFQTAYQVQYDNYRVPVGGEVEIRGTADKPSDTE